jgi:hypothetical protein
VVAIAGAAASITYQSTRGEAQARPEGVLNPAIADGQREEPMPRLAEGIKPRPSEEAGGYRMPEAAAPKPTNTSTKQ